MKVLKVIVDEVPETCMKCNHCYDNTCEITFKQLTDIRFASRPDWCPLVEEGQDAISVIREYVESVQNLISEIISACTYQDEPTAASGRYELPMRCFTDMERLSELSHEIYDSILEE